MKMSDIHDKVCDAFKIPAHVFEKLNITGEAITDLERGILQLKYLNQEYAQSTIDDIQTIRVGIDSVYIEYKFDLQGKYINTESGLVSDIVKEPTDLEKMRTLFTELGIGFRESKKYEHPDIDVIKMQVADSSGPGDDKVDGYSGFCTDYEFDSNGKFIVVKIWE
jgi:hypothetical protein